MTIFKVFIHLNCFLKKILLKITFRKNLIIGKRVTWRNHFSLRIKHGKIIIGDGCFFNNSCSIASINSIVIGNDSIFGENVKIYDHNHKFSDLNKLIKDQGYTSGEVVIGDNCWIGSNVVILKNTFIGDGSIIGAGVVISGNIPPNTIVKNNNGNYIFEQRCSLKKQTNP